MKAITRQRLTYIIADFVSSSVGVLLFDIARYYILDQAPRYNYKLSLFLKDPTVVTEQCLLPLATIALFWLSGYYNHPFDRSRLQELINTFVSTAVATLAIYFAILTNDMTAMQSVNYILILILWGFLFTCIYIPRLAITSASRRRMMKHEVTFPTVVVGNSAEAHKFIKSLRGNNRFTGMEVRALVRLPEEVEVISDIPVYNLDRLEDVIITNKIEKVVLAPQTFVDTQMLRLIERLFPLGVDVKIAPGTFNFLTSSIRLSDIFGEPLVNLTSSNMSDFSKNMKRTLDVILSLLALILLSPLYLLIGLGIKLDSSGPIIYRQSRIGYKRKPFNILKFRTMSTNAESAGPQLSSKDDSRVTRLGRMLRKYRLDELPQFYNVLKGDMSLVGPRPERMFFIRQIVEKAPYYTLLHQVRPGITSWGMVKYGYAQTIDEMVDRLQYDLIYLQNMSLTVDFKIMIYTLKTIITGRGM